MQAAKESRVGPRRRNKQTGRSEKRARSGFGLCDDARGDVTNKQTARSKVVSGWRKLNDTNASNACNTQQSVAGSIGP